MHAMEFSTIWLFVIAAATLLIIPGPAVFYIMARSISHESEDSTLFFSLLSAIHYTYCWISRRTIFAFRVDFYYAGFY